MPWESKAAWEVIVSALLLSSSAVEWNNLGFRGVSLLLLLLLLFLVS